MEYIDSDSSEESEIEEDVENIFNVDDNVRKRAIACFIMQLRACSNITQSNIDKVLRTLRDVVGVYVRDFYHNVEGILDDHGIDLRDYVDIERELQTMDCIQGLHSKYMQDKYFETAFSMVSPRRYELGRGLIKHGTGVCGSDRPTKVQPNEMAFISICEVLQEWLKNESFQDIIEQYVPQENVFSSDQDGLHFFNHPFFIQFPNAFRIVLSFDAVQMCNPIGSKATSTNNLGMIYWSILNIHPKYRANIKFINLAAIVRCEDIEKFGMDEVLAPIVEDLQRLQEGIEGPNGEIVYGALFALCGDNLGVHQVAGFKEGFTAAHPCRFCLANLQQVRALTNENLNLVRRVDAYNAQVQEIEEAVGNAKRILSKRYGINRGTVLNQLIGFSAVTGIPPDLMHDLLEGVMPKAIQCYLLKLCFELNLISLEEINNRIQNFDYGYTELTSKPSIIKKEHLTGNFHQNSSQTWLLFTILPIIVRNVVDEDCEYSQNYTKLLQISSIVLGHSISADMLDYLSISISEYLEDFRKLYANTEDEGDEMEHFATVDVVEENAVAENDVMDFDAVDVAHVLVDEALEEDAAEIDGDEREGVPKNLIPKQHFITHYPRLIQKFGSLLEFWCMRMESKHSPFKRKTQSMGNYKNLPLTLAKWHQLCQTWQLMFPLTKESESGPLKPVLTETLPFHDLFREHEILFKTPWLRYNGTKYVAKKCYIPIGYNSVTSLPIFAQLDSIIWNVDSPILVCQSVRTVEHNVRLMAYEVIPNENDFVCHRITDLVSHHVYHSHVSEERIYIIVKQNFGDLH